MGNANPPPARRNPNIGQAAANNARKAQQAQGYSTFSVKQRQALLRRYQTYDSSTNGDRGIPLDVCLSIPEFAGNKLITILIHDFINPQTGRMHQEEFLRFCTFLSSNTSVGDKKRALFDSFNVYESETFTHDEVFRLYKVLLGHVISDDLILALTFEALQHPSLKNRGEVTKEEFVRMIPDSEVVEKLTVYFNIPLS